MVAALGSATAAAGTAAAVAGSAAALSAGTAIIGVSSAVIGAGVSAYGMIKQGQAQRSEMNYNAAVQDNNAISAGYAAIQEGQSAQREVDQLRETRTRNMGSQRAAAAASGLTISGSVLDTMGDSALQSEKDIQMAYYRGKVGAYNQGNQASNFRSQAGMTRTAGANAARSSYFQAGGSILSGFSQAAGSYANVRK